MYLTTTSKVFAFVALFGTAAQAQFPINTVDTTLPTNVENLIPQWLPQCFDGLEAVNPFDVIDCVQANSQPSCLDNTNLQETVMEVVQCVNISVSDEVNNFINSFQDSNSNNNNNNVATSKSILEDGKNMLDGFLQDVIGVDSEGLFNVGRVFVNATLDCLDPYASCVNETIQAAIGTRLNPCINETITDLLECGRANNAECMETCNETTLDTSMPALQQQQQQQGGGGVLNFQSVQTCAGIQTNLMDPLCDVVSCCEPCVDKVEALMKCIVNQQLEQVPAVGTTCEELTCPVQSQRRRKLRTTTTTTSATSATTSSRVLGEGSSNNKQQEDCLQYSPGLTGEDSEEFTARSAIFFPCVSNSFVGAVQTAALEQDGLMMEEEESSASGRGAGSVGLIAIMAVASFVL